MKSREWKEARRRITEVLRDPRVEPGQRDRLLSLLRELDKLLQSGKPERGKLFRAVGRIASIVLDVRSKK